MRYCIAIFVAAIAVILGGLIAFRGPIYFFRLVDLISGLKGGDSYSTISWLVALCCTPAGMILGGLFGVKFSNKYIDKKSD